MSIEENKAIARRSFEEAWNQGRVDLLDEYYAPDGSTPDMPSLQDFKDLIHWWHKAAPGFKFTILNVLAEEETAMVHWQVDVTYSHPMNPPPDEPFIPLNKPVSWKGVDIFRIVDRKIVAAQFANPWHTMLIEAGAIPLKQIEQNKAAARKFVDALNRQDTALLSEVASPEVAQWWTKELPSAYATFKDHHIDITDMVVDGEKAWVRVATSAYHTGEWAGIPPTGKQWTNQGIMYMRFADGKIAQVDLLFDDLNLAHQLGATLVPAA